MSHSNVELQFEMVSRDSGSERALRVCEMRIMQLRLQVTDRKEKKNRSSDREQLDMRGVLGGTCDFLQ